MSIHDDFAAQHAHVYAYAFKLTRDQDRAQDATQETMLRAIAASERYRDTGTPRAWLFRIARNFIFTDVRNRKTQERVTKQLAMRSNRHVNPVQETAVALSEMLDDLDALPQATRDALVDIRIFGYSQAEVAEKNHVPIGTIKSRVARAAERLARSHK